MKCLNCNREVNDGCLLCDECNSQNSGEFDLPVLKKEEKFDAISYVENDLDDTKEFFINRELDLDKTQAINKFIDTKEFDIVGYEEEVKEYINLINDEADEGIKIYVDEVIDDDIADESEISLVRSFEDVSNIDIPMGKDKLIKEEYYRENDSLEIFNKQNEVENIVSEEKNVVTRSLMDDDLSTKESISKRKNSLAIVFVCTLLAVILAIFGITYFYLDNDSNIFDFSSTKEIKLDNVDTLLDNYYSSLNVAELEDLLASVRSDEDKVSTIQAAVLNKVNNWIDDFQNGASVSTSSFENVYTSNKKLLNNLYNVSIDNGNEEIKLIAYENYNDSIAKVEEIYSDGIRYYEALDMYNSKSYNECYEMLNIIGKDNIFYDKSSSLKEKVSRDVVELLQHDITKMEQGLDNLSEADKVKRYNSIISVISMYKSIYSKVDLENSGEYNSLIQKYNSLVNN